MSTAITEWLSDRGFRPQRENRFGVTVWMKKGVSAQVPRHCSEVQAEAIRVQVEHDTELLARKPKSARARETAAKNRAASERRLREIEAQIELRNRELAGARAILSGSEANRIIALIEAHEREARDLRRLMTEIPTPNAHRGRTKVQHRS